MAGAAAGHGVGCFELPWADLRTSVRGHSLETYKTGVRFSLRPDDNFHRDNRKTELTVPLPSSGQNKLDPAKIARCVEQPYFA